MTIRDMIYITAIAEEKSITKAAAQLLVAQPALSQCVQKVEKELDTLLFERKYSGVEPTEEGRCFLEFAEATLQNHQDLLRKLQDFKNTERRQIRIGFTGTQAAYILPHILPKFDALYPNFDVIPVEASSEQIEAKLINGDVDIGILHPPIEHDVLEHFEFSHDELVVVPRSTSRFQPYIYYLDEDTTPYIKMEFLCDEPLIVTSPGQRSRMVSDLIFEKAGITPNIRLVSKNLSGVDALVQVNFGSALLPRKQLSPELKRRGYYRIAPELNVPYTFNVAVVRGKYHSVATKKMLEFLNGIKKTNELA